MQTRTQSAIETVANVGIGYLIGLASQMVIFSAMGLDVELRQNIWIGAWFTFVSVVRSYCVRRLFNWWHR